MWAAIRGSYSGSSESVHPIRSLRRRRYRGHLCTMVNNQSRSLSFPQRGSVSCCLMNEAKAGFVDGSEDKEARAVGKDMMNGVYDDT